MLYQGDTIVKEIPGEVIPDELFMGPDPLEADAAFVQAAEDQTLTFGSRFPTGPPISAKPSTKEWASVFL